MGDGGGLGGVPGDGVAGGGGGGVEVLWGRGQGGGDEMNAVAAGGGVEDEAGGGANAVGDLGALVGREWNGGVGVAGGDDGETVGGEKSAEAGGEGEGEVFFEEVVGEVGSGIRTSVCGVEKDDDAGRLLGGQRESRQEEGRGEEFERRVQGSGLIVMECLFGEMNQLVIGIGEVYKEL